jgi:spoIIIJ-associated protein
MDAPLEYEGLDLSDALQKAADSLRIPVEDLRYEILQEGRRGFLGVGTRGVRIRVAPPGGPVTGRSESGSRPRESGPAAAVDGTQGPAPPLSPEAEKLNDFLHELLAASPFEIAFRVREEPEKIRVDLDGPDREILLERKGEALQAIQVILGRVAIQAGTDRSVFVDCADFRQQREEELAEIALLVAEKVKRLREPQSLSPMNPYERRLVHLALKDDPDVETRSEGEGFIKRVVVFPRNPGA